MTPNGQAGTQYPQPLQMSSCTTTVPNSVRNSDPVGQTSRQAASVQCLHTSEAISQRIPSPSWYVCSPHRSAASARAATSTSDSVPSAAPTGLRCSTKATCRQVSAPRSIVLSYDSPVKPCGDAGIRFHSLHATSQALQPMQIDVSVKNPIRGCASGP